VEVRLTVRVRYRGRLIDHVGIAVRDIEASRRFYKAVFEALEVPVGGETPEYLWADELFVTTADSAEAAGKLTGRQHIAFQAKNREMVERFYEAGLKAGGLDNGAPGERSYHDGYFAAFLLDPDGNNIEAVYRGEATRSAEVVKVTF
jgi:catechol 2,3-dioxygenase-like lactoylglutathione lyase family enzyme